VRDFDKPHLDVMDVIKQRAEEKTMNSTDGTAVGLVDT
jgi:hypothetical protein